MDTDWTDAAELNFDFDRFFDQQGVNAAELGRFENSPEYTTVLWPGYTKSAASSQGNQAFELPEFPAFDSNDPVYSHGGLHLDAYFDFGAYDGTFATDISSSEATSQHSSQPSQEAASVLSSPLAGFTSRKRSGSETLEPARKRFRSEPSQEGREARDIGDLEMRSSVRGKRLLTTEEGSNVAHPNRAIQATVSGVHLPRTSLWTSGNTAQSSLAYKNLSKVRYQYERLNRFKSPAKALQAIDSILVTFHHLVDEVLDDALQEELQDEQVAVEKICGIYPPYQEQEVQQQYQLQNPSRQWQPELQRLYQRHQQLLEPDSAPRYHIRQEHDDEMLHDLVQNLARQPIPVGRVPREHSIRSYSEVKSTRRRRTENVNNFDPSQFYQPLSSPPSSWGSINPTTHSSLFRYNSHGELLPRLRYTADQILEYMTHHPLHHTNGTKHSGLQLWIQIAPADSGKRYGSKESSQCRFSQCPIKHNTICKGEYRVAFDENSHNRSLRVDPYLCAGYVHLFCMEKFFDFPQICKMYNVIPDARIFREGKNKMAITRDYPEMGELVKEFIEESVSWSRVYGEHECPANWYEGTLSYTLIQFYLTHQPGQVESLRGKRGGNSVDVHLGNLDVYAANEEAIREKKKSCKQNGERLRKVDVMREVLGKPAEMKVEREEENEEEDGVRGGNICGSREGDDSVWADLGL